MRRSKAPPLGRNFVANPLPSSTPIPYRGGWGVTLIGALQYLVCHSVCLSVCLSVCYHVFCRYAQQDGQYAILTGSVPQWLYFKKSVFCKNAAFERYCVIYSPRVALPDPSAVLSTKLGSTLLRKPIATFSLRRQRTSGRQRASHFHGLVNGDVHGSRILITTPTSLSHVRDTACAARIYIRTRVTHVLSFKYF